MNRKEMLVKAGVLTGSVFFFREKIFAESLPSVLKHKKGFNIYNVAEIKKLFPNYSLDNVLKLIVSEIKKKSYPNKFGGGGVIYFPPGIWEIQKTILLPSLTTLMGMGGFFHQHGIYEDGFDKKQHTVIKLKKNANCNIVQPENINSYGIQIKGIILDGNKHQQNNEKNFAGIYLPDINKEEGLDGVRSNLFVQDVMLYNCKGDGIYAGNNQNEFRLDNVLASRNDGNGFLFSGTDILLSNVWAGDNGKNGFYVKGGGAVSAINCDSWGNKHNGLLLDNYTQNNTFTRLQCNLNVQNGVQIRGGVSSTTFIGSVFKQNSKILGKGFSVSFANVKLFSENNNSPRSIKFIGCQFGEGNMQQPATTFGIEDVSDKIFPNTILGSTFAENEFAKGKVNKNVFKNYSINNCTAGDYGGEIVFENTRSKFIKIKNDYTILPDDKIILINSKAKNIKLTLPSLNELPPGTEIKIIKQYKENSFILQTQFNEKLQSITNNKIFVDDIALSYLLVIHAETTWILTK
jgi:hypothetical protein